LKKIKFKGILRLVVLAVCGGVLGLNIYTANASKLVGDHMPMPFGFGGAVVLSGSMEPALSVGDLIIVSKDKPYSVQDIVVYQQNNTLVVHRVVSIDEETIVTQGDANNVADSAVEKSAVKGTVIAVVPMVGNAVNFIKTPIGTILLVVAAIALVELPHRREKQKDDEERQKIIDEINRLKNM